MCLAVPMRIKNIEKYTAIAEADGLEREVNIQFIKNPKIGDYVVIHAGFAIEKVDERKAKQTLKFFREIQP